MSKIMSIVSIGIILLASSVMYAQLPPGTPLPSPTATPIVTTLHLSADRNSMIISVPIEQGINLSGFEIRVLDAHKNIHSVFLADSFTVLELTSGIVEAGSCFVYELTGTLPIIPRDCLVMDKVYRVELRQTEVFWFDSVGNQQRDVAIYRDGNFIGACPAQSDCVIGWEIMPPTPTPTIDVYEMTNIALTETWEAPSIQVTTDFIATETRIAERFKTATITAWTLTPTPIPTNSYKLNPSAGRLIVTAPGDYQSSIGCPGNWQPDCGFSQLQDYNNDGIYDFTTNAIPPGNYEVKIAIDGSWVVNYGERGAPSGANIKFTVMNDIVTFEWNSYTMLLTIITTPKASN